MAFFNFFNHNFKFVLPEIFILLAGLFFLLIGIFVINNRNYKYPFLTIEIHFLTILVLFFSLLLLLNNPIQNFLLFNNLLIMDKIILFSKSIILLSSMGCLLVSFDYIKNDGLNLFEYNVLILFAIFGLLCFVSSYDLVSLYLALEVQSLSFYILATIRKDSAFSTEAGLKYFILGALSSGFLLFGISLIYGLTGTTNFELLAKIALNFDFFESFVRLSTFSLIFSDRLLLGLLFLLAGLLFKLAAAPFHMWSPDVYEGSPTSISMLFAVVPKIGLFTVALRLFFFVFYDFIFIWQKVIILCSFLSILIGTFATLRQYRIKRFLAFSSVTHVGYLLIAFSTGTFEGISSLFFYLIVYVVMLLNAWSIVILLELKKQKNIVRLRYITDLQNLSKVNPVLGFTFLINLFSMAGVPPLAGFYAKVFIFFSAIECSLNVLVIFGILLSVVSAFYYIRFIKIVYFDETFNSLFLVQQISLIQAYVLGSTFYFILFLFIKPEILFLLVEKVSLSLFL